MSCFVVVGMLMVKDLIAEGKQRRERREPFFSFFFFLLESGLVMAVWRQWNGRILKATRMDRLPALTP